MQKPKVLVFDIETTPNLSYTWGKWQQDVIRFQSEWTMLCFAWKWLGEKKTYTFGGPNVGESECMVKLHELFDEADVIIAHNGNSFDIKMCNAKFLEYGMTPPSYYKTIDTKVVAKRYFRFNSNKLDDLGRILVGEQKHDTGGFDTWLGCMRGDKKSWNIMLKYNKQDVVLLEKIYYKLRPWMTNHPNYGDMTQTDHACTKCGSHDLEKRGFTLNRSGKKQRYQCNDCGGWSSEATIRREGRLVNVS